MGKWFSLGGVPWNPPLCTNGSAGYLMQLSVNRLFFCFAIGDRFFFPPFDLCQHEMTKFSVLGPVVNFKSAIRNKTKNLKKRPPQFLRKKNV